MVKLFVSFWLTVLLVSDPSFGLAPPPVGSSRRAAIATAGSLVATCLTLTCPSETLAATSDDVKFQRYPQIRFIAALGDPKSSSGTGADQWGLWRDDPGPRGVFLKNYETSIKAQNNQAPAGWTFDDNDWWLEEHGLIMSTPGPLPRKKLEKKTKEIRDFKRYVVTGAREVTTVLTVFEDGRWELAKGTLFDVTHLPCRSARYTPVTESSKGSCQPTSANPQNFPVKPGAEKPQVPGCAKQDYAVLFVLGEEA